jgi:outer membrane protein insertion porin family
MLVRWLKIFVCLGSVAAFTASLLAQTPARAPETPLKTPSTEEVPIIDSLEFIGLRHISSAAVKAQLSLQPGDRFDTAKLQRDIRRLARLGWFAAIRVEEIPGAALDLQASREQKRLTLGFSFKEEPILSRLEYRGSHLLSSKQIEKSLEEKKFVPPLGKPADPVTLHRMAEAIRFSLNELGHPDASVQIRLQPKETSTVNVLFQIEDGPYLLVRTVRFEGDPRIPEKRLREQMQAIAPWKPFASLRTKNAYSREAFETDRQRLLTYYQDHGYPEARIGNARVTQLPEQSWKPFPFPHRATRSALSLSIPVQAGPFYRLESVEATDALQQAVEARTGKPFLLPTPSQGHAFSQQEVDNLRRLSSARLQPRNSKSQTSSFKSVAATPLFDSENHSVRLKLDLSDSSPYLVHRLEFSGLHKFSDRYVRRRILLREGQPVDDGTLEAGLTRLARTGYFKPIRKEDIRIQFDEARRIADVTIRLEEIGQQRASLVGGHAQFGSTLGLAYTVFDLLNREELLSAQFEAGPETLQIVLGIAKEGIFGTRGSLALSVFNNVLRSRFQHGAQGPFFTSRSEGLTIPWTYPLSNSDIIGINYTLSRTASDEPLGTPPGTTGLPPIDLHTSVSARSLGVGWARDTGAEHLLFSNSASGGLLGGGENMVRSSAEAARLFRDPFLSRKNAWAFRATFNAAGSYRGNMPLYSRFFAGDEFVRGLRTGELGPLAMTETSTPSGATTFSPSPSGANLVTAANAEYRIPLRGGTEAAGFFDLGSGRLLPNWLGPTKPSLLSATNGILHGSTGLELRWTIPGIQVPLRSYYAFNVLRLDRRISLSDKSLLFAHNRFSAFGWGLGSLF